MLMHKRQRAKSMLVLRLALPVLNGLQSLTRH